MTQQLLVRFPNQYLSWEQILSWPIEAQTMATAQLHHAEDHPESYVRFFSEQADAVKRTLEPLLPAAQLALLTLSQSIQGASSQHPARWFYTVETDIAPAVEEDFNRWYSEEHLPGLAAVTGTVLAQRWYAPSASPRYIASYELATRETFGSPDWLAVRATPWSSRIRPHFLNTRRTMFTTRLRPESLS